MERFAGAALGCAEFFPGETPFLAAEADAQCAQRLLDQRLQPRDPALRHLDLKQLAARIEQQGFELAAGTGDAEELRRQVGQLMGLVENERIDPRQQFAVAVFLQGQVGQQQMVIDDHEVGFERGAARREYVAAREFRAPCAGAGLAGAAELRPQRVRLAQRRHFGQIAAPGRDRPFTHLREQRRLVPLEQRRLRAVALQPGNAQVIGPPLQQRRGQRAP